MKEFDHGTELHDLSTYFGRLSKFMSILNPANLSYSDEEIRNFESLLIKSKQDHLGKCVPGHRQGLSTSYLGVVYILSKL